MNSPEWRLNIHNDDYALYYYRSLAYKKNRQYEKAIEEANKGIALLDTKSVYKHAKNLRFDNKDDIGLYTVIGDCNKKLERYAEAKKAYSYVIANVRSMGMAIRPCTVPAAGVPGFELKDDEMEVGIGIHGEPGTHRETLKTADEITDMLLDKILADLDYSGAETAVMINGAGATPLMELFIINNRVADVLAEKGIKVYKTFVGEYMTSLEMEGFSISILRLNDRLKELLDAPADTPAFKA